MSITGWKRIAAVLLLGCLWVPGVWAQNSDFSTAENPARESASPSVVWENVKIIDELGWEYSGVTLHWIGGGRALEISRTDGATKTMDPESIRRIFAADGTDITAEVAEERYSGQQSPWSSAKDESVSDYDQEVGSVGRPESLTLSQIIQPRLFRFGFDAALGYGTQTGSWFAGLDDGVNFQVGTRISMGQRSYLRLAFRHQDLGDQTITIHDFENNPITLLTEMSLREYLILMGTHSPLVDNKPIKNVGYLEFGLSIMDHRVDVANGRGSDSMTKLGAALQGGVLLMLDQSLALDMSASATWKPGLGQDESGGLLMGVRLGLAVLR